MEVDVLRVQALVTVFFFLGGGACFVNPIEVSANVNSCTLILGLVRLGYTLELIRLLV